MRSSLLGISLLLGAGCGAGQRAQDGGSCAPVVFADPALEAAVRQALSAGAGPITADQAAQFGATIEANHLSSLQGLECLVNLSGVRSSGGSISDLSPLAGLVRLTGVEVPDNQVTSLAPLSAHPLLKQILAPNNRIQNLAGLSLPAVSVTVCSWLDLTGNPIASADLASACAQGWYVTWDGPDGGAAGSCGTNAACVRP